MRFIAVLALVALVGCSDRAARPAVDPRVADASRPLVFLTYPTMSPVTYRRRNGQNILTMGKDYGDQDD